MRVEDFSLQSPSPYRIRLAVPRGEPPRDGWPMVTLLGHDAFDAACALVRYHADCRAPGYLDAGVLLGVEGAGERQRQFDYTPLPQQDPLSPPNQDTARDPAITPSPQGGADAFARFLLHELRQTVQARVPLNLQRQALAGHSLGGLFTLHTLFTQPNAFQTYIASSPSVWWGDGYLERRAQAWAEAAVTTPARIAVEISVGEYEQAISPLEAARPDAQHLAQVRRTRAMVDGARRVAQHLARNANLDVRFHVYPGQYHRSVWPMALNLGLMTALQKAP